MSKEAILENIAKTRNDLKIWKKVAACQRQCKLPVDKNIILRHELKLYELTIEYAKLFFYEQ